MTQPLKRQMPLFCVHALHAKKGGVIVNKNRALTVFAVLIVGAVWVSIWSFTNQTNQNLDDTTILEAIGTTNDMEIQILGKTDIENNVLVFYAEVPITDNQNLGRADLGFAYFSENSSTWIKGHSGMYGSVSSYLSQTDNMGFTYEYFPNDAKDQPTLLFGLITNDDIQHLKIVEGSHSQEANYINLDSGRIWYKTFEEPPMSEVEIVLEKAGVSIARTVDLNR